MLKNKKLITIILIIILTFLAGCSAKDPVVVKDNKTEPKVKYYQVGVLLSKTNNDNDNAKVIDGINRATKEYPDIKAKVIKPEDFVDPEEGLRYLAENSYDLIIAVGDEEAKVANYLAREYPEVSFAIVNVPSYSSNLASLQYKDEEGVFLAGAVSGLLTKNNKVAFLGGLEKQPEKSYQKAFSRGVSYISKQTNKSIDVFSQYTGDNWDANKVNAAAKDLSHKGVDLFFNGFGRDQEDVLLAAAANKKYAIGMGENQRLKSPKYVYTSVVDNLDSLIYSYVVVTKTKGFKGGTQYFGLAGDCVSLLDFSKITKGEKYLLSKGGYSKINSKAIEDKKTIFTPDILGQINKIKADIQSGKINTD